MFPRSLISFSLLLVFLLGVAFSYTKVKVRYGVHKDKYRVVLDLSRKVKYRVFVVEKPYRVVVDILDRKAKITRVRLPKGFRYKVGRHPWGVRLVINPRKKYSYRAFHLRNPDRIVLDFFKKSKKRKIKPRLPEKRVIVVDAGHGGKDPGAIGYGGLKEKWVNLRIARYLAYYLRKDGRFKVIMTRKGDYFVPLEKRARIAIKNDADLFISIHADAAPRKNPRARGTQIFALSYRGALKKKKHLMRNKYYAKLVLGEGAYNPKARLILSDLAFDWTLEESEDFARLLALELRRTLKRQVYFKGIRRAGFVVLKTPGIPSVLIEVGFITNPKEARRLKNPRFQKKVAYAIYRAIVRYFFGTTKGVILAERK